MTDTELEAALAGLCAAPMRAAVWNCEEPVRRIPQNAELRPPQKFVRKLPPPPLLPQTVATTPAAPRRA